MITGIGVFVIFLIIKGITRRFNRKKINDIQFNFLHEQMY
jgi:hypothetical protein